MQPRARQLDSRWRVVTCSRQSGFWRDSRWERFARSLQSRAQRPACAEQMRPCAARGRRIRATPPPQLAAEDRRARESRRRILPRTCGLGGRAAAVARLVAVVRQRSWRRGSSRMAIAGLALGAAIAATWRVALAFGFTNCGPGSLGVGALLGPPCAPTARPQRQARPAGGLIARSKTPQTEEAVGSRGRIATQLNSGGSYDFV